MGVNTSGRLPKECSNLHSLKRSGTLSTSSPPCQHLDVAKSFSIFFANLMVKNIVHSCCSHLLSPDSSKVRLVLHVLPSAFPLESFPAWDSSWGRKRAQCSSGETSVGLGTTTDTDWSSVVLTWCGQGNSFPISVMILLEASTRQAFPFHSLAVIIQFLSCCVKFPLREWSYTKQAPLPLGNNSFAHNHQGFPNCSNLSPKRVQRMKKNNSSCCWLGARLEVLVRARVLELDQNWFKCQFGPLPSWPLRAEIEPLRASVS